MYSKMYRRYDLNRCVNERRNCRHRYMFVAELKEGRGTREKRGDS